VRVGFVVGEYPPMQGGVGAFTREVALATVALGHEVFIHTRRAAAADHPEVNVAAQVGKKWGWRALHQARAWARDIRPDVINLQFQTAAYDMHPAVHCLPRAVTSCPLVVTFHDLRMPYLFPKARPLRELSVRWLASGADAVIATERADEQTLVERWGLPRVRWVPIGSNVRAEPPPGYRRDAHRASLGLGPDDLLISYFGFLNESKGGLVLVEALARLVADGLPAHLVMIGGRAGASDPTNLEYGRRVDQAIAQHRLGARVHWTGYVDDPAVSANFLASDITALPYLDGVSLRRGTLMAALAHGQAIVTTQPDHPIPELDDALVTVPPGDPVALADALAELWHNPARRRALQVAAAEAAQLFTWESIARRTLDLYQELIA
jgi:glycosyltransferase involved in cell wall biosynthesis